MRDIKKWPVIRHLRYFWLSMMLDSYVRQGRQLGLGWFVARSDLDFLEGVWKGDL